MMLKMCNKITNTLYNHQYSLNIIDLNISGYPGAVQLLEPLHTFIGMIKAMIQRIICIKGRSQV